MKKYLPPGIKHTCGVFMVTALLFLLKSETGCAQQYNVGLNVKQGEFMDLIDALAIEAIKPVDQGDIVTLTVASPPSGGSFGGGPGSLCGVYSGVPIAAPFPIVGPFVQSTMNTTEFTYLFTPAIGTIYYNPSPKSIPGETEQFVIAVSDTHSYLKNATIVITITIIPDDFILCDY